MPNGAAAQPALTTLVLVVWGAGLVGTLLRAAVLAPLAKSRALPALVARTVAAVVVDLAFVGAVVYELFLLGWNPHVFLYAFFLHFLSRVMLITWLLRLHRTTRHRGMRGLVEFAIRPVPAIDPKSVFKSNGRPVGTAGFLGCGGILIGITLTAVTIMGGVGHLSPDVFCREAGDALWLWLVYVARDLLARGIEMDFSSDLAGNLSHNESARVVTLLAVTAATLVIGGAGTAIGRALGFTMPGAWVATVAMLAALSLDDMIQDVAPIVTPDRAPPRGVGAALLLFVVLLPFGRTSDSRKGKRPPREGRG